MTDFNDILKDKKTSHEEIFSFFDIQKRKIKQYSSGKISFPRPLCYIGDTGFIYPKTIAAIQGKTGVHKSRLAQELAAAMLVPGSGNLGIKADSPVRVLYIDTERNLENQFPYAIQKTRTLAGYPFDKDPPNFDYNSLLHVTRANRLDYLSVFLENYTENSSENILVILDVVTDCIGNFNDVKESLTFIDTLNGLINKYNVTFLCVIHENPGEGDKARGHVGTELSNKASVVVQIGFDKGDDDKALKITFKKTREKPIKSFYVYFDPESHSLRRCEDRDPSFAKIDKTKEAHAFIIAQLLDRDTTQKQMVELLSEQFSVKSTQAKAFIAQFKEAPLKQTVQGWYRYLDYKEGLGLMMCLKPKDI